MSLVRLFVAEGLGEEVEAEAVATWAVDCNHSRDIANATTGTIIIASRGLSFAHTHGNALHIQTRRLVAHAAVAF